MIVLDIETTGFDTEKDQLLEIGAVRFDEKNIYDHFHALINPGIPIPETITHITGIRQSDIAESPTFNQIENQLRTWIGNDSIVGHNISFDLSFLKNKGLEIKNETYDTLTLSSILLPKFTSYSLETLSSYFQISKKQKHRALDDAIINAKLFQKLLEKIQELPESLDEKFEKVLKNTDWSLKKFFLNRKHSQQLHTPDQSSKSFQQGSKKIGSSEQKEIFKKILETLETHTSLLLEAAIGTGKYSALVEAIKQHLNKENEKILILTYSKKLEEYLKNNLAESILLKRDEHYISEKRLQEYMNKNSHQDEEIAFILKILVWLEKTENGLQEELTLQGEEYQLWEYINHDDWLCKEEKSFAEKAKKGLEKSKIIIANQRTMTELLFEKNDYEKMFKEIKHFMILETEKLEEEIEAAVTKNYSLRWIERKIPNTEIMNDLRTQFTIFFGLLGMFLEKIKMVAEESEKKISNIHKQTPEWNRIKRCLENISEKIMEEKTGELKRMKKMMEGLQKSILQEDEKNEIILFQNAQGDIFLRIKPLKQMQMVWRHPLFAEKKSLVLISETLRIKKSFNYIRQQLHLQEDVEEKIVTLPKNLIQKIKIVVPKNFPEPNREEHFNASIEFLKKRVLKAPGQTISLFSGKKALHGSYYEVNEWMKEKGLTLIAQDFSGGKGKMFERYKLDPDHAVLFTTIHFVEKNDISVLQSENLIFTRLTFFEQNEAQEIFKFLRILNAFCSAPGKEKNCYILDNRILKKEYGKNLLTSLPEGLEVLLSSNF